MIHVDPATTEIIRNRLESVAREMCIIMRKTAYSPTMYSGGDYSAGIFDGAGQLISLSTKVPQHIMPIVFEVQQGLRKYKDDIRKGDIFANNSPYHGSTHTPDVNVFIPVFAQGELLAFAALRAHWTDIGGMTPGSISGAATEIFQEGLRLPVIRLGRNGELDPELVSIIMANVRLPREAMGDLRAQIAACRTCEKYVHQLVEKYGLDLVKQAWAAVVDGTERRTRDLIRELPDTTVTHVEYLDNDGVSPEPVRLRVTITIEDDDIVVDYTGSSAQVSGCINATEAGASGMAYVGVKSFLDPDGPINHGLIRPIRVIAPPGTVVNAQPPAATGGCTEIAYNLANLVLATLGDIDPQRVAASGSATANHQYIGGFRHNDGKRFIYYEYQPGGCGATGRFDGAGSSRDLASGYAALQSMEILESRFPVKMRRHEIAPDTGGPGRWRGGVSHVREVQVFGSDIEIATIGEHTFIPPFGLLGGQPGSPSRWTVIDEMGESEMSPFGGKTSGRRLSDGGVLRLRTAGGGGFGDPLDRDPSLVAADVQAGYVTIAGAERDYGVVFADDGSVNETSTEAARAAIRAQRLVATVEEADIDETDGGFSVGWVHRGVSEGPAEIVAESHAPPIRLMVKADANVAERAIRLGPEVRKVLRVTEGSTVWVRSPADPTARFATLLEQIAP
jgi:N-methylhydantoinase B